VKSSITTEQAYPKIKFYCAYRERCHYEVKERLFSLGLNKLSVDQLLVKLIEEGFLNEERFAVQFAGSHFRVKKWGKKKIAYALQQKRISDANIKNALLSIDPPDYAIILEKITLVKWNSLKKEPPITRQAKTIAFLMQKGFEFPLIRQAMAKIKASEGSMG
jgi:regulatory protein